MRTAFVWPIETTTEPLGFGAFVGTHYLASICEMNALVMTDTCHPDAGQYDCLIVNLFANQALVTAIKATYPHIYIIAVPDVAFDNVFVLSGAPTDIIFLGQLRAADCIGYVSESNRQLYGALFPDNPMVKIPTPIGHDGYFKAMRSQEKENFIITCDHTPSVGSYPVDYSIQNVAACAAIQRETGLKVVYVNAHPKTREYARFAGLEAEFHGYMNFSDYARLAARARLGVDAYALHGFGRNTLMYAAVGTPAVGSAYNNFNVTAVEPWLPRYAVEAAQRLLAHSDNYVRVGLGLVEDNHSFAACRKQMEDVLEQVEQWQRLPQPN